MRKHLALLALAAGLGAAVVTGPASAQDAPPDPRDGAASSAAAPASRSLTVGFAPISPFVMEEGERLTGFDVELWRAIARDLGLDYEVAPLAPFEEVLQGVGGGRLDVAMAAVTINAEREEHMDFSHQYMPAGLQIMVLPAEGSAMGTIVDNLFSADILPWLGGGVAFIFLCAFLAWWSDMGTEEAFADTFFPGYFEAVYWTIVTMSTVGYGDYAPKRWLSRVVSIFVIFTGIGLFGTLVAKATTALTVERLQSTIEGPEDLRGRTVATVEGTTSAQAAASYGAALAPVDRIDQAYAKLRAGEVDAVVYDSPSLRYYAHGEGAGQVLLVEGTFDPQYYGIALPQDSELRERINRTLLELRRNGVYDKLYGKYFGGS